MAATARGRDDPEEVAEARGPVLQGAGRTGPPRVPGSGERGAREGAPGRQLGPPGPMDRSRGGGARARGASAGDRQRSWDSCGVERAASDPGRSRARAGAGLGLAGRGRRSRGRPPLAAVTAPAAAARLQPIGAPRPQLQSQLYTARLDLTSGAGPAAGRPPPPRASSHSAFAACLVPVFDFFPKSQVIPSHCLCKFLCII